MKTKVILDIILALENVGKPDALEEYMGFVFKVNPDFKIEDYKDHIEKVRSMMKVIERMKDIEENKKFEEFLEKLSEKYGSYNPLTDF